MTKTVSFDIIDWPSNWESLSQISCLALGKTFPKESDIPDDVNPRNANTTNKIYKDIVRTLIMEPEKFHELNEGVTLFGISY